MPQQEYIKHLYEKEDFSVKSHLRCSKKTSENATGHLLSAHIINKKTNLRPSNNNIYITDDYDTVFLATTPLF